MAEKADSQISGVQNIDETKVEPVVWIVVLNWNRPQDTIECVASLHKLDYPVYHILVVDNGSTDKSVDIFQKIPGIHLIENKQNLGFAAGNNRGIEYALQQGADYVLLLNNDTTVSPTLLSHLIEAAQTEPEIGIVGPVIYYTDRPDQVWFAGMRFRHGLYVVRRGLHLAPPLDPVEEVDFVSGCGMLVPRQTWERVGLFDPRFFMYYEDLDLCIRAQEVGYRIVCATQAHMWHTLSASTGGPDSPLKQYYQVRSTLLFSQKHTRGLQRVLTVTIRLLHAGLLALRQILRGQLQRDAVRSYLKGIVDALRQRQG